MLDRDDRTAAAGYLRDHANYLANDPRCNDTEAALASGVEALANGLEAEPEGDIAEALTRAARFLRPPHSGYAPEQGRFLAGKLDGAAQYLADAEAEAERWKAAAATASIERDEARAALEDLLEAYETVPFDNEQIRCARARAEEVMEGVERTHVVLRRDVVRNLAGLVETIGEKLDGTEWSADTPTAIADALANLLGLPPAQVIAAPDEDPRGAAKRFADDLARS